ncbi:ABC transporter permease [Conexibacter arvalis]|uniref:ABC-type dipeptide/oligopeptide/nickel transport system permease subunit n=1 Tax=Conexibacter arvalis TaxID=912552 RepID=A0A840I863_9ACTN|nr:ABC transporter permease [Conexibacter arvalis]MBB4660443.1 ABC-type dipeptide/oligopeptide/nickel transport system permease subunit [Conexibacter arvalis]
MSVPDAKAAVTARDGRRSRSRSRARRTGMPVSVALSAVALAAAILCAIAPGLLAPQDPALIDPAGGLQTASGAHLLGTDALGRDVLSRVVAGARSALVGPLILTSATVVISTFLALLAGYLGGWFDAVVSRVADTIYALPALIVTIVIVGVFGGGWWLAIGVLVVFNTPTALRILRAAVIERRDLPYVEAARTIGVSRWSIMVRHLLPNLEPMIVTCFFLGFTYGMVELSALSFLGLGVPPGSPDWGRMLAENRVQVAQNPWAAVAPGIAIVATVLSANILGGWIYERLERRKRER